MDACLEVAGFVQSVLEDILRRAEGSLLCQLRPFRQRRLGALTRLRVPLLRACSKPTQRSSESGAQSTNRQGPQELYRSCAVRLTW